MPFKADGTFKRIDTSVTKQLNRVLSTDSPLIKQAQTSAAQVANRRGLLNSSMAVQAGEAAALNVALPIASQQAAQLHQKVLQKKQIKSTEKLGFASIASFEKEKATAALAQFDTNYQNAFSTISSNENLPAASRESLLKHLLAIRDSNFNLVEQLYNIDLVWASAVV